MEVKKIYCIIVTYNGMQWIDKCLTSLQKSSFRPVILVIDNGSSDGTPAHIANVYKDVRLTIAEKNLGFGQGNNAAIKVALSENADFYFLLNQDAWVNEDTIEKLVNSHISNPAYGILSPVHLNGKGNAFDEHFEIFLSHSKLSTLLWHTISSKKVTNDIIDTPFVNAAAWLISKQCIEKIGGFDPIFFHYGEDDNYVHRVRYHGMKIGILPTAFICHDKERKQINPKENRQSLLKKDFIQFLVYACDINNDGYNMLIFRKLISGTIKTVLGLVILSPSKAFYNFSFTKKVFLIYTEIRKSRLTNSKANLRTHLSDTY